MQRLARRNLVLKLILKSKSYRRVEQKEWEPPGRKRGLLQRREQLPKIVNRWSWGAANPFDFSREPILGAESWAPCWWEPVRQSQANQIFALATHSAVHVVKEIRFQPEERVSR